MSANEVEGPEAAWSSEFRELRLHYTDSKPLLLSTLVATATLPDDTEAEVLLLTSGAYAVRYKGDVWKLQARDMVLACLQGRGQHDT